MSTLTKVCVVVLFVACLFASVVMIQHVYTSGNYKKAFEQEVVERKLAEAQQDKLELALQVANSHIDALVKEKQTDSGHHAGKIASMQNEISRLNLRWAAAEADVKQQQATLVALEKDLETQIALNKAMKNELDVKRGRVIQLSDQLRGVTDVMKEKDAEVEQLESTVGVLREREAQAVEEAKRLRKQLAAGGGGGQPDQPVRPKGPKIDGSITAVKGNIAALNVGAASGVEKGTEFIIYRGSDFVARLRIADVYPSSCAGIVLDAQRDVLKGDKATTSLE